MGLGLPAIQQRKLKAAENRKELRGQNTTDKSEISKLQKRKVMCLCFENFGEERDKVRSCRPIF